MRHIRDKDIAKNDAGGITEAVVLLDTKKIGIEAFEGKALGVIFDIMRHVPELPFSA